MRMNTFFTCFEMFIVGSNYPNMAIGEILDKKGMSRKTPKDWRPCGSWEKTWLISSRK